MPVRALCQDTHPRLKGAQMAGLHLFRHAFGGYQPGYSVSCAAGDALTDQPSVANGAVVRLHAGGLDPGWGPLEQGLAARLLWMAQRTRLVAAALVAVKGAEGLAAQDEMGHHHPSGGRGSGEL